MSKNEYVKEAPKYFESFSCKCGECRNTCCRNWKITLSMGEYHRLLGMNCSKKMRRLLDGAFCLEEYPDISRYASVRHTPEGDCPLLRSDGYCALQRECGEDVLPSGCREYPRAFRREAGGRVFCLCSGSCEKTVELLMSSPDSMEIIPTNAYIPEEFVTGTVSGGSIAEECVNIMSGNSAMEERLTVIGRLLGEAEPESRNLPDKLSSALAFLGFFGTVSRSLSDCAERAFSVLGIKENEEITDITSVCEIYMKASEHLDRVLPDNKKYYTALMLNNMYYTEFPQKRGVMPLVGVYVLLRLLTVLCTADAPDSSVAEIFADVSASLFRLAEHSPFAERAAFFAAKHPQVFEGGCVGLSGI